MRSNSAAPQHSQCDDGACHLETSMLPLLRCAIDSHLGDTNFELVNSMKNSLLAEQVSSRSKTIDALCGPLFALASIKTTRGMSLQWAWAISCVSFHQVLRSPRGLPLCGACMERKRHCRAGWTMRASKLRGSACTICTCDFFRNWGLLLAKPMGCARFTHISMPYWPQCALRASFRMSSTVLKPAGLLVSCKQMMLSLNERICSLRYWSLPAYPSGPTKRDPTFRVARLKVNWAGVFLVGNMAVSKWGFVKGSLGGVISNPEQVRMGKPASRCIAIHRKGRNGAHLLKSICCLCSLWPWAASVLAR